jgi:hypothetical protein
MLNIIKRLLIDCRRKYSISTKVNPINSDSYLTTLLNMIGLSLSLLVSFFVYSEERLDHLHVSSGSRLNSIRLD